MKATDLMIGDWVTITEPDDFHGYIGKVVIINAETNYITVHIPNMHPHDVFVEDLQPIPLTPEILEKTGFKEDFETKGIYWRPDCRKFCIVKELDTWYFAFRLIGEIFEKDGEIFEKSVGHICISECNYVHKLQHILKDLEIEKEIVL